MQPKGRVVTMFLELDRRPPLELRWEPSDKARASFLAGMMALATESLLSRN
jgi:hypothetical protein